MHGVFILNLYRFCFAFLFVTLTAFSFGQSVQVGSSNVRVNSAFTTTYKTLNNSSVRGVSSSASSTGGFGVRVVGGSASTTFIDPKGTINAVPASSGQVNLSGRLGYNTPSLQSAWKSKVVGGVPSGSLGASGWFGILQTALGAHSDSCLSGNIDFLCLGRLEKKNEVVNLPEALVLCSASHENCYLASGSVFYTEFVPVGFVGKTQSDLDKSLLAASTGFVIFRRDGIQFNANGQPRYCGAIRGRTGTPVIDPKCGSVLGDPSDVIYEQKIVDYCSVSTCPSDYIEQFVPFTPRDLDGVELPIESMSDADFALAASSVEPDSIFLDPIPDFSSFNVVTSTAPNGDITSLEVSSGSSFSILGNGTSSPSVSTTTTTTTNEYLNGDKVSSSTVVVSSPPPASLEGDWLTKPQLDNSLDSLSSRFEASMLDLMGDLNRDFSSVGDSYDSSADNNFSQIFDPTIIDFTKMKEDYIFSFGVPAVCPAPYVLSFDFFGRDFSVDLSYHFLCEFLEIISYLIVASAYITCAYIYLGLRRV